MIAIPPNWESADLVAEVPFSILTCWNIVSSRNDRLQNYDETVLVLRNPEWEGAKALARVLKTNNVLVVHSNRAVVDAAVYIGKDFEQIIEPEQGETNDNE